MGFRLHPRALLGFFLLGFTLSALVFSITSTIPKMQGQHQSPIDIRNAEAEFDVSLTRKRVEVAYEKGDCKQIVHTGTGWQIMCDPLAKSTVTAAHLPGTYRVLQAHAHWGSNPWNGSEHLVLGTGYASEIHIVHYNTRYGNFQEAVKHKDGLAVLGIFISESPSDNPDLEPLIEKMRGLRHKDDVVNLSEGFDLDLLLPKNLDMFWTYEGSLTTPPYTECVVWTVFRDHITLSFNQLKVFRNFINCNVRPPQKLAERKVRASFELGGRSVSVPGTS